MSHDAQSKCEAEMTARLAERNGPAAVALLVHEPAARFGKAFNRSSQGVDAALVGEVYQGTLDALAAKVAAGLIGDVPTLVKMMHAVLGRRVLHARVRSFHRSNPRLVTRRGRAAAFHHRCSTPLFVPGGDPDQYPGGGPSPADAVQRREMFPRLLAEARWLGPLRLRVFREVRRFERARGTTFGAFQMVARLAVLDDRRRIARLRPLPPDGQTGKPPPAVVRQVRKLYGEACRYVENRAFLLGYRVKSLA